MANPSVPNVAANNQGSIKLSEVSVDNAEEVIDTVALQDGLTAFEQLRRVSTDSLRKSAMILISTQPVNWNGPTGQIVVPVGVSIILKLLLNPASATSRTINLMFTGTPTTWNIPNGGVIYIELERSIIDASSGTVVLTDGINAAGTPGQRIILLTQSTMPVLESNESLTNQSTISIPLVLRQDDTVNSVPNIWWIPHGILWSSSVNSYLGEIQTSTTIPLGGILPYSSPSGGTNSALTQAGLNAVAPGFWLCDGSQISNASSPFYNYYAPNLNGNPTPTSGLNTLFKEASITAGSNVINFISGYTTEGIYVGQLIQTGSVLPSGTYITGISGNTSAQMSQNAISNSSGPFIFGQNTFLQGNTSSPNNSSGYSGNNSHIQSSNELANHTHLDAGHTHQIEQWGGSAFSPNHIFFQNDAPTNNNTFNDAVTDAGYANIESAGGSFTINKQPAFFNVIYIMRII